MARRRWVWDRCIECHCRLLAYYRCIPVCRRCFEAWCRIDDEAAAPGELRSQRVQDLRPARTASHPIRSLV